MDILTGSVTWTGPKPDTGRQKSIRELAEVYIAGRELGDLAPASVRAYRFFLGHVVAADISGPDDVVLMLRGFFEAGKSTRYMSMAHTIGRGFYTWLEGRGRVGANPFEPVRCPRVKEKLPTVLTCREAAALVGSVSRGYNGVRLQAILRTFLNTGLRVSELCALDLSDRQSRTLTVRHGKGGRARVIPLTVRFATRLGVWEEVRRRFLRGHSCPAMFPTRRATRPCRRGIYEQVRKLGDRAGVAVTPHVFRHTFATWYIQRGGSLECLREIMGHASIVSTQRYLSLDRRHVAEDLESVDLDGFMEGPAPPEPV